MLLLIGFTPVFLLLTALCSLCTCHLITLSARYTTDCGIVRPICLAIFRLNSNLVEARTGSLCHFANNRDRSVLTLPAFVYVIDETALVQLLDEPHIDKVFRLGSFCLGVRLR